MRRLPPLNLGDWIIVVAAGLAAVLFVVGTASAVISLHVEHSNQRVLGEIAALAKKSDRNHADNLDIERLLNQLSQGARLSCQVPKP